MSGFLLAAAAFILAMVALGLIRALRGPTDSDRLMSAQLLGTGGIAVLLLVGAATGVPAVADVALTFALLGAFATFAFVQAQPDRAGVGADAGTGAGTGADADAGHGPRTGRREDRA